MVESRYGSFSRGNVLSGHQWEYWTDCVFLQADSVFSGISTFGRLDYHPCLASDAVKYDIAFIGKPDPDTNLVLRTILTVDRCSL